ncbi:MAG: hypothetical protein EXQ60_00965 [Candidatus Nanopelagicales bacterium]|nr:hypothetical protein [Candidatus Nanopelagicales bacterium]
MNEQLVRGALARVFEHDFTFDVRSDTPLSSFGALDEAWVMLARAIAEAAKTSGQDVELEDTDICEVQTFGELVALVDSLARTEARATT